MTIVHCIFTMETGGAQMLAVDILNGLVAEHSVHLIIVNNKFSKENLAQLNPGVQVHFIGRKEGSKNPLPLVKLNRLLFKLKPAVVHCHEPRMGQLFWRPKVPSLLTVHNTGIENVYAHRYSGLVAISRSVAADVKTRQGLTIPVVNNGVDISTFRQRQDYTLPKESPLSVVQVSRLVHETKGQHLLLEALSRFRSRFPEANMQAYFIGDGPSRSYLEENSARLGLKDYVHFLGTKDRSWIKEHLCDYHILAQPSTKEGFGLTIVEGAAAGLPIVASDMDGPQEITGNSPEGLLFPTGDIEGLVHCLQSWVKAYQEGSVALTLSSPQANIKQRYNITSTIQGYLRQYEFLKVRHPGSVSK